MLTPVVACSSAAEPIESLSGTPVVATVKSATKALAAGSQPLIYLSRPELYVYPFPQGRLLGQGSGFVQPSRECVDASGNIFIIDDNGGSAYSSVIYKFAHGATVPFEILNDPGHAASCSFDSTTGDLAVSNTRDSSNPYGKYGDVAIYANATGLPAMVYSDRDLFFETCAYDDEGNLYLTAAGGVTPALYRLSAGSSEFKQIDLDAELYGVGDYFPTVQWDGKHLTVTSDRAEESNHESPITLYRLSVNGNDARVIGSTQLDAFAGKGIHIGQTWIDGKSVLGIMAYHGRPVYLIWAYPRGGNPEQTVALPRNDFAFGIVVSRAVR